MSTTITRMLDLEVQECANCGIIFAAPGNFLRTRREDINEGFYCPNGHRLVFKKSKALILEAEKAALEGQLASANARLDDERKQHEKTTKILTRTLKRAEAGVCQHCNKTFTDIQRHMACKHGTPAQRKAAGQSESSK